MDLKPYIKKALRALHADLGAIQVTANTNESPVTPAIPKPNSMPPFDDYTSNKIKEDYAIKALQVQDFENFQKLLEEISLRMSLNVNSDLTRIAEILNGIRIKNSLKPL